MRSVPHVVITCEQRALVFCRRICDYDHGLARSCSGFKEGDGACASDTAGGASVFCRAVAQSEVNDTSAVTNEPVPLGILQTQVEAESVQRKGVGAECPATKTPQQPSELELDVARLAVAVVEDRAVLEAAKKLAKEQAAEAEAAGGKRHPES